MTLWYWLTLINKVYYFFNIITSCEFIISRAAVIKDLLTKFIKEFNEQNPLSKLSFIITQNEDAELISDFSSSQEDHVSKLKRNNTDV